MISFIWLNKCFEEKEMDGSEFKYALSVSEKSLAGGQGEKTPKSTSVPIPTPSAIQVTWNILIPNNYLFLFSAAKNVIKSTCVICHAALTVGSFAFSTESLIVSSCYWTRIKSAFACSFLCANSAGLLPGWLET